MRVRNLIVLLVLLWAVPAQAQIHRFAAVAFTANAQTCADSGDGSAGALTVTVSAISYVALTQSDAHGCVLTLSETGAQDGQVLTLVNVSANSASIADSSGVQEMSGGTTVTLAQWAAVSLVYRSDRWVASSAGGGVPAGAITSSGLTMTTARVLGRTTASTGAIEELTSVPATLGGTGLTAICADDEALVSNGSVYQCKDIPDCNTVTEKLLYDDGANTFSCQTDQTASGAGSGNVTGPGSATDEALARFDTGTGQLLQDSAITLSNTGALTFPDGIKQTFNPDGTTAGINVGSHAGDPGSPANGDLWYDSSANELSARINGATVALGAGGGGTVNVGIVNGRLTLTTGVAITTSDVTGASTLYFTPYNGNQIALYDGADWQLETFAELSLALSGLTSGKNYDAFIDYNGGTPQLVLGTAWTNDTTRAVALTTQDGVYVLTGSTDHRYVGTIRTTGTTTTEDSGGGTSSQVGGKRFVWNAYNRVARQMAVIDTTDTWNYVTATIRQANAPAANQVEYVIGLAGSFVEARVVASVGLASGTSNANVGIGADSITAYSGARGSAFKSGAGQFNYTVSGAYAYYPSVGYHYLAWLEKGGGGTTAWLGDNGGDGTQSGLYATIMN